MNVYIPPIIEKVYNVQGSTAAPGSGEYHRYRAMRRRERTLAAAMEKEYKQRKFQKEFDERKENKKKRLDNEREKKKRRRIIKEQKNKLKKKLIKVVGEQKSLFRKDIPILEQIKGEVGEAEYKKLLYGEGGEIVNDYDLDFKDSCGGRKIIPIQKASIIKSLEDDNFNECNENVPDENLQKLFPQIKKDRLQFDNYDDYEEHLQILEIIERNERLLNERESHNVQDEPKYVEEEEKIIIHDDEY
jgi:hypothetical protein